MFAKCDYLTINIYSIEKFVLKFSDKIDSYEHRFMCNNILNHFVHGAQCLTFRYSGKNIAAIGQSFFDIIRELTYEQNYTCSRIDFCIDFDADLDYRLLDLKNQETAGVTGRFGNERAGRTLSAGTRGYKLVRLYEKGKEQNASNQNWQRLEVEFSQHLARHWLQKYLDCENDIDLLTANVIDSMKSTMPITSTILLFAESFTECKPVAARTHTDKFMRHLSLCSKALSETPSLATDIARRLSDFEFLSVISAFADEACCRSRDLDDRIVFARECAQNLSLVLDATLLEKREYLYQVAKEYQAMTELLAIES